MVARRRGHVVNLASMAGYLASTALPAYCATKAAVIMLSTCLRADWRAHGVGVSAICPGVINTPIPKHTRMVGAAADNAERAARVFRYGHSPDLVAKAIVSAVEKNREFVPVGFESRLVYGVTRLTPRSLQDLMARAQSP
jgi:short-subunit dehydrogenase